MYLNQKFMNKIVQILDVSNTHHHDESLHTIHSSRFIVTTCQATQLWDCHMYKSWRDNLPTHHLHQHHVYNNNNSGPQTHHKNAFSTSKQNPSTPSISFSLFFIQRPIFHHVHLSSLSSINIPSHHFVHSNALSLEEKKKY